MRERKKIQIITWVTEDDRAWVDQEADKQGLGVSSYVRMTLRQARYAAASPEARDAAAADELLVG